MAIASIATADLSDIVFSVEACLGGVCTGFFNVTQEDGTWDGDTFTWQLDGIVEITDEYGTVVGILGSDNPDEPTFVVFHNDPQVNLGFAMQAGSMDTTFTIRSALLEFDTILNAQGQASVGVNVSDVMGDGATMVGAGPDDRVYLAQYNQFVPNGTTFATLIDGVTVTEPFDTVSVDDETGWQPITGAVDNMSSQIMLTLSAFDMASGTSNFEIIPEPASLLMLVFGVALARRR
ncbi:MAG: hypothetical protein ABIG44_19315 [Planctomycetota bacterium]